VTSGAATITSGAATATATVKFLDGPDNVNLQVVVDDENGGQVTKNLNGNLISVANVAPSIDLSRPDTANEGDIKTYNYSVTDPGDDPNPEITEDCGANGTKTDTPAADDFKCTFPEGPASSTVWVSANDGDDVGTDSKTVTVANVAPTLGLTASSHNVLTGGVNKVIFTANASDVPADPITYTWSGGDPASSTATGNPYKAGFSTCGDKTVTVTASDGDTGSAQMTKTVKAWNAIFQAPIKDGSVNTASKGQVLPVKATIGCGTTNLTTLQPVIQLLNGDATPEADSGTTALTASVSSADTGQFMRPIDAGYIYNLQTPSAAAGTKYTIRVNPWGAPPAGSTQQQIADWNLATGMYALLQIRK
jgi:hypothetical protein